ncbi:PqqD family protein [Halosimplex amylolyticum]|uniref:PqqD family protein n=1 Tax=Halosimplex amylolyticum TaxID=3396616 RepID=UPI003F54A966
MTSNGGDDGHSVGGHTFVASEDVLVSEVDDELVLLDEDAEIYYGINSVGAFLWEQLSEPKTVEELETATASEFDVSLEECRGDVRSFVDDLYDTELVERV